MRNSIPALTFTGLDYGDLETPWDLTPLLYVGGARVRRREVTACIANGDLGKPIRKRLPLVAKLYAVITARLAGGGSRFTAKSQISSLRSFYSWADNSGITLTKDSARESFLNWAESLHHRQKLSSSYKPVSAFSAAMGVSVLLDEVLGSNESLIRLTNLRKRDRSRLSSATAGKQNLEQTTAFGHMLLDLSEALTVQAIHGPLPLTIQYRSGKILEEWSGMIPTGRLKDETTFKHGARERAQTLALREKKLADGSTRTRQPLINLRIQAEILIFIAQTGMNLAQAVSLRTGKFFYASCFDGYQVRRIYKNRRKGEIEFQIYSQYRSIFERYLSWREALFPKEEDLLFPLKASKGRRRSADIATQFCAIKKRCRVLDITYVGPRILRSSRSNWLMRRSRDQELTAEMNQHTQSTLLSAYDKPNHQVAVAEIVRFHLATDPCIAPPGPGACVKQAPAVVADSPPDAPRPDCISPAGCMFCIHHRDIDSLDHVWSLASYRHYKSLEVALDKLGARTSTHQPAELVMERLTSKLRDFETSSEVRRLWVLESHARVEEGEFHPKWDGFIRLLEVSL